MIAESGHGLRLAQHADPSRLVQALRLDYGQGDVPIEARVMGEVDALLGTLAEGLPDLVALGGK
jgi:hypothetical protein